MAACPQEVAEVGVDNDQFAHEKLLRTPSGHFPTITPLLWAGPQIWVGSPVLPFDPAPASPHMCLPSPFPGRPCTWVGSLSKHPEYDIATIASTSCPRAHVPVTAVGQSRGPYFSELHTLFIRHKTGQWVDFSGAALWSVVISYFHILRHEIGHSLGRPRSTNQALWVVVVNEASLTWPGVGRLHHHTPPQGLVSLQLSPKKVS